VEIASSVPAAVSHPREESRRCAKNGTTQECVGSWWCDRSMVDDLDGPEVTMILGDRAGTVLAADDRFLAYFGILASIVTFDHKTYVHGRNKLKRYRPPFRPDRSLIFTKSEEKKKRSCFDNYSRFRRKYGESDVRRISVL